MAEERLQQAGIARYQAIENLAREMFAIAAGAAIAQWQRNAARDTFRDMEKMKTLPLKREALRKAAYHNEMDFMLWKVQWEEVIANCNKFNKVQALMIGHQSNETIYTALRTIADQEGFTNQDEEVQYEALMEAIDQSQKGNLSFEALKTRFEKGIQPQDINPIIWWQRMLAMQRKLKSSNEAYDDNIENLILYFSKSLNETSVSKTIAKCMDTIDIEMLDSRQEKEQKIQKEIARTVRRMVQRGDTHMKTENNVLAVHGTATCNRCKRDGHVEKECYAKKTKDGIQLDPATAKKDNSKRKRQEKEDRTCYTCGKPGHLARDCYKNRHGANSNRGGNFNRGGKFNRGVNFNRGGRGGNFTRAGFSIQQYLKT